MYILRGRSLRLHFAATQRRR